ncbi:MAG: ATPase [Thaumarchaeota archaeon]|nr:MAG: ATPase [Nitrososphaerota archaeon]
MNKTKITAESGRQELFITREFDAPRELVFKAFTDPKLYTQWLGPRRYTMNLEKFEPRSGGMWRYTHKDKDGNEFGFHGVYHEVLAPERMIDTFEFEGLPEKGHVSLETAKFMELPGGRTRVTMQSVFQSIADRDGMMQSGMEEGVNDSFDRLDELLEKNEKRRIKVRAR